MIDFLENYKTYPIELTTKQFAAILGCSTKTIYSMLADPDCSIFHYKVGRRFLIPKLAAKQYILRNHHTPENYNDEGGNE